jgi:hypothetical protein
MSTLNVNRVVDASGGVLAPISSVMRNRIINGDMRIDQRNAGVSVSNTTSILYTLDRWLCYGANAVSKFTVQQNAGSITPPVGFVNYLGVTSSAATSISSSDIYTIGQYVEGFNISDLGWGTANAKTVTLSFQIYSSLTGTFGGAIQNSAQNRSYPFSYTVSSANTWTAISITIAGDTGGTWLNTNGIGLRIWFGLGAGSTYSGTAGAWATANLISATGATSVVSTNGATWFITGVQLEVGTQATGFEYRQYGTELALCQRYYEVYYQDSSGVWPVGTYYNSNNYFTYWAFQVEKRAQATVTRIGGAWVGVTPILYNGISSTSFNGSTAFYLGAAAGTKCLEAAAEL